MVVIILLSLFVVIGVPLLVLTLIKMAVDAKENHQVIKQWFILWLLFVLTILGIIVFTVLFLL